MQPEIERGTIRSRGLTRSFGQRVAVRPFDLDVEPGSVVGLLGPNGSGKSTFMRMLLGLVPPDAGTASVDGIALAGEGVAVRRRCTFSPGEIGLYRELRGAEHLDWLLRGRPPAARIRGRELCHALGLPLEDRVRSYSHGMKRQLLFAAAMAPQVRVRLLDEPTEGLDPERRAQIVGLIHADAAQGVTILLSSHHLGEIERACQRLLFLGSGALIADEDVATLRERTARLLLLRWPRSLATPELEDELISMARGAAEVLRPPPDASLLLDTPDPRPFLASLAAHPAVPQPESIQYGSLSLQDLYRELYGVEGI